MTLDIYVQSKWYINTKHIGNKKEKEKKKNYPIDLSLIKSEKQVIVVSFHNNRASPWKSPELQALFLFHK